MGKLQNGKAPPEGKEKKGPAGKTKKGAKKERPEKPLSKSKVNNVEIEELTRRVTEEAPGVGSNPWLEKRQVEQEDDATTYGKARRFGDLALSQRTLAGLARGKWEKMTDIQRAAIPHALAGRDILGAARTGSGKTLAFLVPMLEALYRERWGHSDGLGALVVSPTRELALQIFDVLRILGHKHQLSAGLVIGGKDHQEEAARICGMNVLVRHMAFWCVGGGEVCGRVLWWVSVWESARGECAVHILSLPPLTYPPLPPVLP